MYIKTGNDALQAIEQLLLQAVISFLSMVMAPAVHNIFRHLFTYEMNHHLIGSEAEMLLNSYPSHTTLFDI